jgi:hypothetical protein
MSKTKLEDVRKFLNERLVDLQNKRAKEIIALLKKNDITVSYNDKLKTGGRSLKIYNPGPSKAEITKVKKLLTRYKTVTVKNWAHWMYPTFGVIRIHVK